MGLVQSCYFADNDVMEDEPLPQLTCSSYESKQLLSHIDMLQRRGSAQEILVQLNAYKFPLDPSTPSKPKEIMEQQKFSFPTRTHSFER